MRAMPLRALAMCVVTLSASALLQGCTGILDLDIHADESPQALARVWEIDVPSAMTTTEFYGSDVGFQGDGDFVRVMHLLSEERRGNWDPTAFQSPLIEPRAWNVVEESEADLDRAIISRLRCRPSISKHGEDYLLLCYDHAAEEYYAFESLS